MNIEGNDLIGFDDKGHRKLIITKDAVPSNSKITDGEEKEVDGSFVTKVEPIYNSTDPNLHVGHSSVSGNIYRHHFWMEDLYRDHDEPNRVTFKVHFSLEEACYLRFDISSSISLITTFQQNVVGLYQENVSTPITGNIGAAPILLDSGDYYLNVRLAYVAPRDYTGMIRVGLDINSVKMQRMLNCNILGNNGLVSRYGSDKYLFFNSGEGFEVRFGEYGLRVNADGLRRYSNGAWLSL